MKLFLFLIIVLFLLSLSWTDLRYRVISNKTVLMLSLAVVPFGYLSYGELFILSAIATLVIGFLLFHLSVFGGGDVKLVSVLMLAIPSPQIIPFFFWVSLVGLLLVLIGLLFFRQSVKQQGLPYGIAIGAGFVLTQWLTVL